MAREQKHGAAASGMSANVSIDSAETTTAATNMMKTYALFSDMHDSGNNSDSALYTHYLAADSNTLSGSNIIGT
jgi:hypothetical protein